MERLKKKLYFIYNPLAGKGNIRGKLFEVIQALASAEYEVTVYPTREPRDATERVRELPDGYDLVVCCGGDGTLDEVVTGMMQREKKLPSAIFRPDPAMISPAPCRFPIICSRPRRSRCGDRILP